MFPSNPFALRGGNGQRDRQDSSGAASRSRRPSIGVALGGGAARGWAHIGVLRTLEEAGFKPDIIAGTSIGAVVGGCYTAGKLDLLETFARGLSKRRVFNLMDFSFAGSGLLSGNRLGHLLAEAIGDTQIEDLPRHFACIATELGTGHEIWLSRGHLVDAMRASYALPAVFKPVMVQNRWLIDGALVNPVPVSVCRAFGARLVIAVNLNAENFGRGTVVRADDPVMSVIDEGLKDVVQDDSPMMSAQRLLRRQFLGSPGGPPGISTVMVDAFNIIQDRISRSRLAGDPPDITIGPKTGAIGLFDFHCAKEAIVAGAEATRRVIEDIRHAMVTLS